MQMDSNQTKILDNSAGYAVQLSDGEVSQTLHLLGGLHPLIPRLRIWAAVSRPEVGIKLRGARPLFRCNGPILEMSN